MLSGLHDTAHTIMGGSLGQTNAHSTRDADVRAHNKKIRMYPFFRVRAVYSLQSAPTASTLSTASCTGTACRGLVHRSGDGDRRALSTTRGGLGRPLPLGMEDRDAAAARADGRSTTWRSRGLLPALLLRAGRSAGPPTGSDEPKAPLGCTLGSGPARQSPARQSREESINTQLRRGSRCHYLRCTLLSGFLL